MKKAPPLTSTAADLITQLKKVPGQTKIEIIDNKLIVGSTVFNVPYKDPNLLILSEFFKTYSFGNVTFSTFPKKAKFLKNYADVLMNHKLHADTQSREHLYEAIETHLQQESENI